MHALGLLGADVNYAHANQLSDDPGTRLGMGAGAVARALEG
jgi:hypothetical protein